MPNGDDTHPILRIFIHSLVILPVLTLALLVLSGCSSSHYKKKADQDAYDIISKVEYEIFGQTNEFSINTRFSDREPGEILSLELIEDSQNETVLRLTLDEAIQLGVENSRTFQTQKEQLFLTALSLTETQRQFQDNWFSRLFGSNSRSSDGERSGSAGADVGFNKALMSGASLGMTIANDLLRFYTGDPRRSAVSTISFNLTQPLLRGAGRKIVAENLTQAERNVVYAVRDYTQFQKEFAVGIVNDYFRLLQNKDIIRNVYANYQRRIEATARALAHQKAGNITIVAVGQTQQDELSAKNSYINSVVNYQRALDAFKIQLGIPVSTQLIIDDTPLEELRKSGLMQFSLDAPTAYGLAVTNFLPLLNDIDQFEDSKRKIVVAANQLKADLNIFADGSLQSDRPTDYTEFDLDDVRWNYGVELNLPIDRLRERNSYRSTIISFESAIRQLSLSLDSKRQEIENGLRTLKQLQRNFDIEILGLKLAEERVESTQLFLEAGQVEQRDLRESLDALVNTQNSVTAALVEYLSARLELMLNLGTLDTDMALFWQSNDAQLIPDNLKSGNLISPEEIEDIKSPDEIFSATLTEQSNGFSGEETTNSQTQ